MKIYEHIPTGQRVMADDKDDACRLLVELVDAASASGRAPGNAGEQVKSIDVEEVAF